jgi:hypothetical protein
MTHTIIIALLITAVSLLLYFARHFETAALDERARYVVIREREDIASRLLYGYCRKLILDTENRLIYKDEVLERLVAVLNVQGYDPRRESVNSPDTAADGSLPSAVSDETGG